MEDQAELERSIDAARDRGDTATLERLRDRYRSGGFAVTRIRSEPVRLRETQARFGSATTRSRSTVSSPSGLDDTLRAPVLGAFPSSLVVVVGLAAQWSIRNSSFDDGLELAGGLFGRLVDGELRVENASVMHDVERTSSWTRISRPQLIDSQAHFSSAGWHLVGCWHCHPGFRDGVVTPSEQDRRSWRLNAEHFGIPLTVPRRNAPGWVPHGCPHAAT